MFSLCSRWQSMQYNVAHGTFSYNQLGEKTSEANAFVLFVFSFLAVLTEGYIIFIFKHETIHQQLH